MHYAYSYILHSENYEQFVEPARNRTCFALPFIVSCH
jgi:hypothetical protein